MTPDQIAETRKKAADAVRRPDTDTEQVLALLLIDIADALEAERARCAGVARMYAAVNIEMAGDTIMADPILRRAARKQFGPITYEEAEKSETLMVMGAAHSQAYHVANHIANAIERGEQP